MRAALPTCNRIRGRHIEVYLTRLRLRPTRRVECFYHSGGFGSLIDAFQTTVKRQLGLPSLFLGSLWDTATTWHSPSDLTQRHERSGGRPEAFSTPLPPRKLASEEKEVYGPFQKT